MTSRHVMGKEGMTLAVIVGLAVTAMTFITGTPASATGDMGICLPSPNLWISTGGLSWGVNVLLLLAATLTLYLVNKQFAFVPGSDTVLTGMFVIMAATNPLISGQLTSSFIMVIANLLCLLILFGCYRKRNATQEIFLIATILSLGSMMQYAFIFMLPVYLTGAILMKCFNFKVLVAYLMGICAPYWVGIGLGLIPFDSFTMPTFANLFSNMATRGALFVVLMNVAVTVIVGFILALNNIVKLYAGNTRRRLYNTTINLLGIACTACLILDYNNMIAYLGTIYMIAAVQFANLFALWHVHRGGFWVTVICMLYAGSYVATLYM